MTKKTRLLVGNIDELHFEEKCGAGGDDRPHPLLSVGLTRTTISLPSYSEKALFIRDGNTIVGAKNTYGLRRKGNMSSL